MRRCITGLLLVCIILFFTGCAKRGGTDYKPTYSPAPEPSLLPVDTEIPQADTRQTFSFLFFSDTQPDPETGDYSGFGELLSTAVSRVTTPELIIFGGDTVNDGGDEAEWEAFKNAVGQSLDGSITAAVAGNHDSYMLLAEQFDYPTTAPHSPGEAFFYTLHYGGVFFVMLDSNIMGAANQKDVDWLQNELQSDAALQADWIIAVMHHPMWPVADNPKDVQRAEKMREYFLPLLEDNGTDLILCGHQHIYSRTMPMRAENAADNGQGIIQIMVASGDKASYAAAERDYLAAESATPCYLMITIDKDSLSVTAYDAVQAIDEFVIHSS